MRRLEDWAAGQGLELVYLAGRTGEVFSPKLTHAGNDFHPVVVGRNGALVLHMRRLLTRTDEKQFAGIAEHAFR